MSKNIELKTLLWKAFKHGNDHADMPSHFTEGIERDFEGWFSKVKNWKIDFVSGCFPTENEVEEAAESFADLYMYEADFANGCEAGWNACAEWMKQKYNDR